MRFELHTEDELSEKLATLDPLYLEVLPSDLLEAIKQGKAIISSKDTHKSLTLRQFEPEPGRTMPPLLPREAIAAFYSQERGMIYYNLENGYRLRGEIPIMPALL